MDNFIDEFLLTEYSRPVYKLFRPDRFDILCYHRSTIGIP